MQAARVARVAVLALGVVCAAAPAFAQAGRPSAPVRRPPVKPRSDRLWLSVSGGVQGGAGRKADAFDLPLYAENEHITVDYPSKLGPAVGASLGYRIGKHLLVGAGVTYASASGHAGVAAAIPHPFFDNTFRNVEGTAATSRAETGAHILLGWMVPVSRKTRLVLTAGPSVVNVRQTLVSDVTFSETYPFDTAAFTGAITNDASSTGAGFNAGADLSRMIGRRVALGVQVQVVHAQVREHTSAGRSVSVRGGGVQGLIGFRFVL